MYTIGKRFSFDAAHHLTKVPSGHKCRQVHGHTYTVELVLRSESLDMRGFVMDYGDMTLFKEFINDTLDHTDLNERYVNPTAETIAKDLYDIARVLYGDMTYKVIVQETPNTYAEYME